jgi:hypothetical protein
MAGLMTPADPHGCRVKETSISLPRTRLTAKSELMKLACTAVLIALIAPCEVFAQGAPDISSGGAVAHPAKAVIAGVVTKEPGSDPVKKALIELIAESQSEGGNYTALSGVDGGFRIENIVPGRYRLFVERAGFQEIDKHHRKSEGRVLTLVAGQELKELSIHLQAGAVVEGRITDEDGDPMAEAQVAVLRQAFLSGRSHWDQVGAERTNDRGEYRIAGLGAGNYFVSVTPPPDFRSLIETTNHMPAASSGANSNPQATAAYQTTYYPGTTDRGQAASIQLHGGDDFPLNLSLTPNPSLSIRGSVVNLSPRSNAAIMLQSRDFGLVLNGAETHQDGSFEIRGVSPGAYTIVATVENGATPLIARQSVQLTTANVEGVRLAPQTGGTIRGRLRMEASGSERPDPSQMFLVLCSADGDDDMLGALAEGDGFSPMAHVGADGSFEWKNVPPGNYSIQISEASTMPDWFLKSVTAGGRDGSESGFTVSGGTVALDLMASGNGAFAEGVVTGRKDEAVADVVVIAVPEARFRNRPERYRKAVTDQAGRFSLRGLPPGDYTLYAWESLEGEEYYSPEFLKSSEGQGKTLHLNEGDRKSVQIKVIAGEDLR